jgi:hypothetical protein
MHTNAGIDEAIRLASEKLAALDKSVVCARTGAVWDGNRFLVPWMGRLCALDAANPAEKVLWLHYLTSSGGALTGSLMAFREIKGAAFYEPKFIARAARPIIKRFGRDAEGLLRAGLKLGGVKAGYGDCAVTIPCFPHIPVTYIVWEGDGELPPEASVLFDKSAAGWLHPEDLVFLASFGAYGLLAQASNQ